MEQILIMTIIISSASQKSIHCDNLDRVTSKGVKFDNLPEYNRFGHPYEHVHKFYANVDLYIISITVYCMILCTIP